MSITARYVFFFEDYLMLIRGVMLLSKRARCAHLGVAPILFAIAIFKFALDASEADRIPGWIAASQAQIAGARAANALGLSAQVPAKSIYLTDGPSRRVVLGKRVVNLRHASPKHLIAPGSPAGTVVQALRHVGPLRAADVAQIAAHRLSANDKKTLAKRPRGCARHSS